MIEAHAIDIARCTECPYVGEHTRDDKTTQCLHPLRLAVERLEVFVHAAPPKHCPHRTKVTLLRVVDLPSPVKAYS